MELLTFIFGVCIGGVATGVLGLWVIRAMEEEIAAKKSVIKNLKTQLWIACEDYD